jgi:predicted RNA-binding Zn-ribbon protein involved in translation (DUF1610 family)
MDEDRKYRQHGYMDADRERRDSGQPQKPRGPQGPRTLQDPNGPRLPRLVQSVTAARCYNCSTTLPPGTDYLKDVCPKCGSGLHCCKQCSHFEPSTRFQCVKPIPARIPYKDKPNECELFSPKLSVMRDGGPHSTAAAQAPAADTVRTPNDARAAFDSLFKK